MKQWEKLNNGLDNKTGMFSIMFDVTGSLTDNKSYYTTMEVTVPISDTLKRLLTNIYKYFFLIAPKRLVPVIIIKF